MTLCESDLTSLCSGPLVVKYRKGDEDTLMDKISKLSMHSIIKKSNRVSSHLKHLTGISLQVGPALCCPLVGMVSSLSCSVVSIPFAFLQIKDEAFDEAEKRFRLQERLIKSFIRDISLYLQHIRVGLPPMPIAVLFVLSQQPCAASMPSLGVPPWYRNTGAEGQLPSVCWGLPL